MKITKHGKTRSISKSEAIAKGYTQAGTVPPNQKKMILDRANEQTAERMPSKSAIKTAKALAKKR